MLSKIVLAGLLPAIMASPIMPRSGSVAASKNVPEKASTMMDAMHHDNSASDMSRKGRSSPSDYTSHTASGITTTRSLNSRDEVKDLNPGDIYNADVDNDCGCGKSCKEEDGVAGMMICLSDCLHKCPDGSGKRDIKPAVEKKDTLGNQPGLQSGPSLGSGATSYEGCMAKCRSDCQSVDLAGHEVAQCLDDECETSCAQFVHVGSGILPKDKRQLGGLGSLLGGGEEKKDKATSPAPLQSGPTLGSGATSYEGCMSKCRSDCQSVELAGHEVSQCLDDECETSCAQFAHADTGILPRDQPAVKDKRQLGGLGSLLGGGEEKKDKASSPAPLQSGPTLGSGATFYEGCMTKCRSDCQAIDFPAQHVSQCLDDECEASCAQFAHANNGILSKKDEMEMHKPTESSAPVEEKRSHNPYKSGGVGGYAGYDAASYQGCMARCGSDCVDIDSPSNHLTHCDNDCAASCAGFLKVDSGILYKKEEMEVKQPAEVSTSFEEKRGHQPYQGGYAGYDAKSYEGCMSACRSDCTTIDSPSNSLSHCDSACEASCAGFSKVDSGIIYKREETQMKERTESNSHPEPYKTKEEPYRSKEEPYRSNEPSNSNESYRPGPFYAGYDSASYESCMSGCRSDCVDIDSPSNHLVHCDNDCAARCVAYARQASGIVARQNDNAAAKQTEDNNANDKRQVHRVFPENSGNGLQNGPTIGTGVVTYQSCMGQCAGGYAYCSGFCQQIAIAGSEIIGG